MLQWVIRKIIGSKNQRVLKQIWPTVGEINRIEEGLQAQKESILQEKTAAWK